MMNHPSEKRPLAELRCEGCGQMYETTYEDLGDIIKGLKYALCINCDPAAIVSSGVTNVNLKPRATAKRRK